MGQVYDSKRSSIDYKNIIVDQGYQTARATKKVSSGLEIPLLTPHSGLKDKNKIVIKTVNLK